MKKVARHAGVSQASVSRVVNGHGYVSEQVVESVVRSMRELGYQPRRRVRTAAAASAVEGGLLALVMLDATMETHPTLAFAKLRGVEAAAAAEGLTLVVVRATSQQPVPPVLKRRDLVGVLLWGIAADPRLKAQLGATPTMWLSSHTDPDREVVLVGNEQAGQLAAEHLQQLGVRRPAFLCPQMQQKQHSLRGNGFRYAFHLVGTETHQVTSQGYDGQTFEQLDLVQQDRLVGELVDRLLAVQPAVDGVFISEDQVTCLAYGALAARGVQPGRDMAIVSCGNETAYLRGLTPRPATIDLAPETTGRLAVEQLLRMSRQPDASRRAAVLITPKLIPGEGDPFTGR
jgi:DNA-binding LacI/PurR family transcriptional regulator